MLDLGFLTRSRVRLVRQTEIAECGLASLTMVANYHGLDIDLGTMRRRFAPSLRGAALKTLIGLADRIGLTPRAVKLPLEQLPNLHVPAVLHWDMNHYVVLERMKGDKALIHNPDGRSTWMPVAEVSDHFTGVALELRPSNDFQTGKQRERLKPSQLWQRMTGIKRALLQVLVLTLVLQAFVLASPYYMQLAIDQALPGRFNSIRCASCLGAARWLVVSRSDRRPPAYLLFERSSGRLLWLNPLLRFAGYAPVARGASVLDQYAHGMLAVHNLSKLEDLAASVAAVLRR